ncbi:MAG: hypothetical protein V1809_01215 [Planctomycetota bacterium]
MSLFHVRPLFVGTKAAWQRAAREAHVAHGYTLAEIGRHLNVHYTTVSKMVEAEEPKK